MVNGISRRPLLAAAAALALLVALSGTGLAEVKNPDTLIFATYGEPETLDPAYAYDTASGEVIYQVYENLIAYDGERLDRFVPLLATAVPSTANGLISADGKTYRFPIRSGVRFHNGALLTPQDVEYSFERAMLQDRSGGPVWMLLEPLLGTQSIEEYAMQLAGVDAFDRVPAQTLTEVCRRVQAAVEVEGDTVVFRLAQPYPPFLSIVAQSASWAAVLNKNWAIAQGDWDGRCDNWVKWHDPKAEQDPLYSKMNGTGPYRLVEWQKGSQVILTRNETYWRRPAPVKNVIIKYVPEWATRQLMLQTGDADIVRVDPPYLPQVEQMRGVKVYRKLPWLVNTAAFFTFRITPEGNDYIGSGKLDGQGIPPDFFSDLDVRKAFNYSFDWETYVRDVMQGEATQARGPIPASVPYHNPEQPVYTFDLKKAEEHFRKAWGGQVWEKGFKFTLLYNEGNDARRIAAEILEANVESLNPKFQIEIQAVPWPTYLQAYRQSKLPIYIIGWLADFPDPHNFVLPYLHSQGTFSRAQKLPEDLLAKFDALIAKGVSTVDPQERRAAYYELQRLAYENAVDIFLVDRTQQEVMRDWVKGFVWNPIRPGRDFYTLSK